MKHVPWITLIVAALFLISPFGQDLVRSAFFSGEQLARSLSQFLLMILASVTVALAAVEWGVKFYLRRRRSRATANG
jgi:hypothetical protein